MLFGNKDSFAVQVELDQDYGGVWLFGRACYWICGDQVGDYDLGTSLRDVLFLWERISCDAGNRGSVFLKSLPAEELGQTLQRSMYGYAPNDHDEALVQRALDEQWARHEIRPNIDIFGNTLVWLVEDGLAARCVYKIDASSSYKECSLRSGSFDQALQAAIGFLLKHYDVASVVE